MSIRFVAGDLLANTFDADAVAHGCNCRTSLEARIAKTFRQQHRESTTRRGSRRSTAHLGRPGSAAGSSGSGVASQTCTLASRP
jgi:hypothetical protein